MIKMNAINVILNISVVILMLLTLLATVLGVLYLIAWLLGVNKPGESETNNSSYTQSDEISIDTIADITALGVGIETAGLLFD